MFQYRDILKKSLAITWGHKYLWFFGIFAALLGGVGRYSMSFSGTSEDWSASSLSSLALFFNRSVTGGSLLHNLALLMKNDPLTAVIFIAFTLIMVALCLFLLWLAVISQAGLTNNGAKIIESGAKKERTTIKEGVEAGLKKFWPVLGFNLIAGAVTCFFAVLVGLPLIFLTPRSDSSILLLYILLFLLFIPLSLVVSFLAKYAVCFSVIKKRGFVDSVIDACRLFGKYWLISLEMALILFLIDFSVVVVLGLVFLILAIPYLFAASVVSLALFSVTGLASFFSWATMAGVLLAIIAVVAVGAAVTCFKMVAWTDIFLNLADKKGGLAKLERLAASLKK